MKPLLTTVILLLVNLVHIHTKAQDTSLTKKSIINFLGYLETYYCYDFSNPSNHLREPFFYSFNKHNEVNLNIGMVKANYSNDQTRSNLAFMAGTYPQYNMAAEKRMLRNTYEANAGIKISNKKNLWIDAGIMPSHIGFESAIGKDCWNLTRSILADNSPYYETGIKLGYTSKNEKLYLAGMYLNGWQRIQKINNNHTPAFGTQVTYKPKANTIINWSTYVGNEQPDSLKKWRYFNNFYGQFQLTKKLGLTTGFDIGMQQHRDTLNKISGFDTWYSPVVIFKYVISLKTAIAMRAEYYSDKNGVIISTANRFQTFGYSANFDYLLSETNLFRIEGRALSSNEKIFNSNSYQNYFITTSLAISF